MRRNLILVFCCCWPLSFLLGQTSTCKEAESLIKTVSTFHYQPRAIDDTFSYQVFDQFISTLDPDKTLFSDKIVAELSVYRLKLDDQLPQGNCEIIEKVTEALEAQIAFTDSLLGTFQNFNFQLGKEEYLPLAGPDTFLSREEIKDEWRKNLKMQTYFSVLEADEDSPISEEAFKKYLPEVIESEKCELYKNGKDREQLLDYVGQQLLYTIAQTFDPHTNYFAAKDMGAFEAELSVESLSFGIGINQNQLGEIVVEDIQPGGPAWNSHQLNEGDIILKAQVSGEDLLPLTCINEGELERIFFSSEVKEVTFHIKKKSGKVLKLNLVKEVPQLDEQAIQSFVLNGSQKIGYISLPDFYSGEDWVSGCATDVAKELIKLKREGIKGLILDLRNNGGGYVYEAIQLAGLFINYGTLAMSDAKDGTVSTMKDPNRGTIFNKSLIVLVNSMSASASELFAATIQDHNRGLIVGANTFGKGSMQTILPLDAHRYSSIERAMMGSRASSFVKLTIGKFYRVNGESLQQEGVSPDVPLPSVFDGLKLGEEFELFSLPNSMVSKKAYFYPSDKLPISEVGKKSQKRLDSDTTFQLVRRVGKELVNPNLYIVPLQKDQILQYWNKGPFSSFSADWSSKTFSFEISNPEYLKGLSGFLEDGEEVNKQTMEMIREDIYVQEAYRIMEDLINIVNKP